MSSASVPKMAPKSAGSAKPLALKPGPFQIIEQVSLDVPSDAPKRRHDCNNYQTCLNLAAAMNWDSFTCRGCSGDVNTSYMWRAQAEAKRDKVVKALCSKMPEISMLSQVNKNLEDCSNITDSIGKIEKSQLTQLNNNSTASSEIAHHVSSFESEYSYLADKFPELVKVVGNK